MYHDVSINKQILKVVQIIHFLKSISVRKPIILLIVLCSFYNANCQEINSDIHKSDTTFTLVGDTLFSNKGFNLYIGQKVIAGHGSDENGWYRYVRFNSAFTWEKWLFRDMEINNNMEYQSDESKRDQDKVKEFFRSGDTLVIKKIIQSRKKKIGTYLILKYKSSVQSNFRCFIPYALNLKELLLVNE